MLRNTTSIFSPLPPVLLILLAASAGAARAAEPAPDVARARADYELGTRYWDLGQYEKALEAYRSAYTHRADPALLFNVAQCLRKLRRPTEALDMYRSFLRRAPKASNRADVERIMKALEEEIAATPSAAETPILLTPPPQPPQAAPAAAVTAGPPPEASRPLLRRPWVWGVAAVVAAGVVTGVLLATRGTDRTFPCDGCVGSRAVPVR